jgi:hypothetical protein
MASAEQTDTTTEDRTSNNEDTYGVDPDIWESLDEEIQESIALVSSRMSQISTADNADHQPDTGDADTDEDEKSKTAHNFLPRLQELSLIKSVSYAYRTFYVLYQQFPHNDVVQDLMDQLTCRLKPFFQHVYKYRRYAKQTKHDIEQNITQLLQERVSHSGEYDWIPLLEMHKVETVDPPEGGTNSAETVLEPRQCDEWTELCCRLFSRFVHSNHQYDIVNGRFSRDLVYSSKFNIFSSSKDPSKRLELHRMIPLLRRQRPEQFEELYQLYYNMMAGFAFNRLVMTGKQEPVFRQILKHLFSHVGPSNSGDDILNQDFIDKMFKCIQSDEQIKRLMANIDMKRVDDFQSQVSFMFTHFSQTGVMQELMKNDIIQNISQKALGTPLSEAMSQ